MLGGHRTCYSTCPVEVWVAGSNGSTLGLWDLGPWDPRYRLPSLHLFALQKISKKKKKKKAPCTPQTGACTHSQRQAPKPQERLGWVGRKPLVRPPRELSVSTDFTCGSPRIHPHRVPRNMLGTTPNHS